MNTTTITKALTNTPTLSGITWRGPSQPMCTDEELIDLFATAGITVEPVDHCNDLTCPTCFGAVPAKAA